MGSLNHNHRFLDLLDYEIPICYNRRASFDLMNYTIIEL